MLQYKSTPSSILPNILGTWDANAASRNTHRHAMKGNDQETYWR